MDCNLPPHPPVFDSSVVLHPNDLHLQQIAVLRRIADEIVVNMCLEISGEIVTS